MSGSSRKRTVATAGASLALVAALVGVGLTTTQPVQAASALAGVEQLQQAQPSGTPATRPGGPGARGQRQNGPSQQERQAQHQAYLDALAARLGISSQQLQDAMTAVRQELAANRPAQKPNRANPQERQARQQAYLDALAAKLGKSSQQLQDAMKQARIDLINKAVAEGKLDQERANRLIQVIQSGQRPGGPGGPGAGPRGQGQPGRPGLRGPAHLQGVADVLGMTPDQLRTELKAGKSLAQIGQERGVSRDTLKAKLLEAHKARLDEAVAAGRLTAEQAQQMMSRMSANIDRVLDATPGQRRPAR